MNSLNRIVLLLLMPCFIISMERYPKRKQPEIYGIIPDKKSLEVEFLSRFIQNHNERGLAIYHKKISSYINKELPANALESKEVKEYVSHYLVACGLGHKKIFLADSEDFSVGIPHCSKTDDVVVMSIDLNEHPSLFDWSILHEMGHISEGHLLDIAENKLHNHMQEFNADDYACRYLLSQKKYIPVLMTIADFLKKHSQDSFTHPASLKRATRMLLMVETALIKDGKKLTDILEDRDQIDLITSFIIKRIIKENFSDTFFPLND